MKPRCYNRPDYSEYVRLPDGYDLITADVVGYGFKSAPVRREVFVPDPMSKTCQQWGEFGEARRMSWECDGCRHDPRRND